MREIKRFFNKNVLNKGYKRYNNAQISSRENNIRKKLYQILPVSLEGDLFHNLDYYSLVGLFEILQKYKKSFYYLFKKNTKFLFALFIYSIVSIIVLSIISVLALSFVNKSTMITVITVIIFLIFIIVNIFLYIKLLNKYTSIVNHNYSKIFNSNIKSKK